MPNRIPGREGQRCVSLGFQRSGDTRKPITIILQVQDSEMRLTERLEMDPKQFADVMSGLATWVDDEFADHRDMELVGFATWLSKQTELDVDTVEHAIQRFRDSKMA